MKEQTAILLLSAVLLAGCSNSMESAAPRIAQTAQTEKEPTSVTAPAQEYYEAPTPEKEAKFHSTMIAVAKSTKKDPKYHRMALNTAEEKRWFKDLMYRLWDRQITRQQFIAEGVAKYPDHKYEFSYIANAYQNY